MANYDYDNIEAFKFSDSRAYREVKEQAQYVLYRKQLEEVVFKDGQIGYYVSVIREIHGGDDYDSIQSEAVIKQKVYIEDDLQKAEKYFLSDRK